VVRIKSKAATHAKEKMEILEDKEASNHNNMSEPISYFNG
jgi:hypothetical protein